MARRRGKRQQEWDGETVFLLGQCDEGTVRELADGRVTPEIKARAKTLLDAQAQWTLPAQKTA